MSNDLIMDMSKNIFKLDKEVLIFKIDPKILSKSSQYSSTHSEPLSEVNLYITNLTSDYIALRTKTTKKENYAVNPTYCIVPPNGKKSLNFVLYNKPGQKLDPKGHKFKFEGFIIPESQKNEDVKDLFKQYISKGTKVVGNSQKRYVQFSYNNENVNDNDILRGSNNPLVSSGLSHYTMADDSKKKTLLLDKIQENEEKEIGNIRMSDIITGKSGGKFEIQGEKEQFENLKKEYYVLKEQLENLKRNENMLDSRIKKEKNKKSSSVGYSDKFKYKVAEVKEKKISKNKLIGIFIFSMLIGFYLVK